MISIVIPTLNEGDLVISLLDYLSTIDGVGQIVVVDASGSNKTRQNQQKSGHRINVLQISADRPGRAAQMNQGARQCTEDAIFFLHCDSIPPKNTAALIENKLKKFHWGRFDLRLDGPGFGFRVIEFMIYLRSRLTALATGDQGIFVNRDFFWQQGGFADIALMEDIEFSKRLGKKWPPGLITNAITTSTRRWEEHGTLSTIWLMWRLRFLYWLGKNPDRLAEMYRNAR